MSETKLPVWPPVRYTPADMLLDDLNAKLRLTSQPAEPYGSRFVLPRDLPKVRKGPLTERQKKLLDALYWYGLR